MSGESRQAAPGPRTVLAIDTATADGAVALRVGERLFQRPLEWRASFRQVAPAVESVLEEAGLRLVEVDAIGVPAGPGSFTGLRVGAAMALGLARLSGRPLCAVPTLAAVAEAFAAADSSRVCATLDARRNRRYAALYERREARRWKLLRGPLDVAPEELGEIAEGAPIATPDDGLPGGTAGGALAAAVARLAAADPGYGLAAPQDLRLVYARAGVDPP